MTTRATAVSIAFLVLCIPSQLLAEVQRFPAWNFSNTHLVYGPQTFGFGKLDMLGNFTLTPNKDYEHCRWGVLMSQSTFGQVKLPFTWLTQAPFESLPQSQQNSLDLFMSRDANPPLELDRAFFPGALGAEVWFDPSNAHDPDEPDDSDGEVKFSVNGGTNNRVLYRYLDFPRRLSGAISGSSLDSNTRKAVILVHGWNPKSQTSGYTGNFAELYSNLASELSDGWMVAKYDWHRDADTGRKTAKAAVHGTRAAEIARQHGWHLGDLLAAECRSLERVHFIAHSAGSWAAHEATRNLLRNHGNNNLVVQVTLLDPFVPQAVGGISSTLSVAGMERLDQESPTGVPDVDRLFRLENYYADDVALGTQEKFPGWDNPKILGGLEPGHPTDTSIFSPYDGHDGPIGFYADSVQYAWITPPSTDDAILAHNRNHVGWRRSMFSQEPVISQQPQSVVRSAGQSATFNVAATTRVRSRLGQPAGGVAFQWFKDGLLLSGESSSMLQLANLSTAHSGDYSVLISNGPLKVFSDTASLSVSGAGGGSAPAAPTSLLATAVSSTQINLAWTDRSPNESGFNIQRKPLGGAWSGVLDSAPNIEAFANATGLSPTTTYVYRIRAYNSAGSSVWSNEAQATTLAPTGTTHSLWIGAVDQSTGKGLSVSSNSYQGASGFQSNNTPYTRSVSQGTNITVDVPDTLAGGKYFQSWLLAPDTRLYDNPITLRMDGGHILIAQYNTTPPTPRLLESLDIEGPSSVDERNTAQYRALARFSDGSSNYVNATWSENSSHAVISATGVFDAGAVTTDREAEIEAKYSSGGIPKTGKKDVTIRNTDAVSTYRLTLNATNGRISASPNLETYPDGTKVRLSALGDDGFVHTNWSGDAGGTDRVVYVTMDSDKSVTANFIADTRKGRLRVNIEPQEVVAEGAQWRFALGGSYRDPDEELADLRVADHIVTFKDVFGWQRPDNIVANIIGGELVSITGTYTSSPGSLRVNIEPSSAVTAGARWRIGDGTWNASGTTVDGIADGEVVVEFESVDGWIAPPNKSVTISRGRPSIASGFYSPPVGTPILTSIAPINGPREGGTLLTLEGANFTPASQVLVGGTIAPQINFISSTRLTALTPASATFGSASIEVDTGAGVAISANGFSYSVPRGNNMTLITSTGGSFGAVATSGQWLYVGQGTTFSVYNASDPSNPQIVSSVPVPGLIRDIDISGTQAIVAADDAGFHMVDILDPTSPRLRGFYSTSGKASAVEALAGRAYALDEQNGLLVLDVGNPDAPTAISTLELDNFNWDITLRASPQGFHAFVSGRGEIYIVDIANPLAPSVAGQAVVSNTDNWSIAVAGDLAFVGVGRSGGPVVDISDLNNPVAIEPVNQDETMTTIFAAGNRVFFSGLANTMRIGDVSGTDFLWRGDISGDFATLTSNRSGRMSLNGQTLWIAGGGALSSISVSDPDAPAMRYRSTQQSERFDKLVRVGSKIAVASFNSAGESNSLLGYFYSNNSITQTNDLQHDAENRGLVVSNGLLLDFRGKYVSADQGSPVFRVDMTPGNEFQPLPSAIIRDATPVDAYSFPGGVLAALQERGTNNLIIAQLDASRTGPSWFIRQKALPYLGPSVQVAGNGNTFVTSYIVRPEFTFTIESWSWNNSNPSWRLDGFERISELQLSHNGRYLHVGETKRYMIYDLSDSSQPVLLSTTPTNGLNRGILIDGETAYIGADGDGVLVFDISDKATPRLERSYDTPSSPVSIAKLGDRLFVADSISGLLVLGLPDIAAPEIFISTPVFLPEFETTDTSVIVGGGASDNSGQLSSVIWSNDRGGGGIATGTTDWLAADIQLQPGENILTVTATDLAGNTGTDIITITSIRPDTVPPVIMIATPSTANEFSVFESPLALSGSAVDDDMISQVTWSVDNGTNGTAVLSGGIWSISDIALVPGPNLLELTAEDASGNQSTISAVIFLLEPDSFAPEITIQFPTLDQIYETSEGVVTVSGIASDDVILDRVEWQTDTGSTGVVAAPDRWNAPSIPLQPGLNLIDVTAYDGAGNSSTDTISVIYNPLSLDLREIEVVDGEAYMAITGTFGELLTIEVSSNLKDWVVLTTVTVPASGTVVINDPEAANSQYRYYRVVR